MAKVLKVSKSGFYAYLKRPKSNREIENDLLLNKIKAVYKKNYGIYGYPLITNELKNDGAPSKNRVYRLMRKNGIKSKVAK
ncbi:IS3 family transposase [Desulfocucumis palustris]